MSALVPDTKQYAGLYDPATGETSHHGEMNMSATPLNPVVDTETGEVLDTPTEELVGVHLQPQPPAPTLIDSPILAVRMLAKNADGIPQEIDDLEMLRVELAEEAPSFCFVESDFISGTNPELTRSSPIAVRVAAELSGIKRQVELKPDDFNYQEEKRTLLAFLISVVEKCTDEKVQLFDLWGYMAPFVYALGQQAPDRIQKDDNALAFWCERAAGLYQNVLSTALRSRAKMTTVEASPHWDRHISLLNIAFSALILPKDRDFEPVSFSSLCTKRERMAGQHVFQSMETVDDHNRDSLGSEPYAGTGSDPSDDPNVSGLDDLE